MTPIEDIALATASASAHFLGMSAIEAKDGTLLRNPVPSKFQMEIFAAYEWLLDNNQPIRIIAAPKARQSYGSTTICHICYHHTRRFHTHGLMMADEHDRTKKIWAMFQRFADNDEFVDYWDSKYVGNTEECRFHFKDPSGAKRVATWEHETANDAKAGAAGTRQVLWFSECMRYKREGEAADTKVIGNAINSVPNNPGTAIFLESTAEGPAGYAYAVHQGAVTLTERIAGNYGNGWVKVFCPWHECEDYKLDPKRPENAAWFVDGERFAKFQGREAAGRTLYGWTAEQIAWRRQKIVGDMTGDEALFDRDYPESEDVAFASSGNLRFDHEGIAMLLKIAKADYKRAARGTIQEISGEFEFELDRQNGYLWIFEEPKPGCSYCVFGDFMEGEQADGDPENLDCHAVGVLREAYIDERKIHHPDEVVAAIDTPGGCQWETDVIADRIRLLSGLFGGCIVVPESNNSGAVVIVHLKGMNVPVMRRRHPDHLNPNKTMTSNGFRTTTKTKPQWVESMAQAIRAEPGEPMKFVCRYLPAVEQMSVFVRNPNGTCSAMSGKHDDWVAAIGIALKVREFTTIGLDTFDETPKKPSFGALSY
jgi:hypothetical protein